MQLNGEKEEKASWNTAPPGLELARAVARPPPIFLIHGIQKKKVNLKEERHIMLSHLLDPAKDNR
jgi:hypothetical protein